MLTPAEIEALHRIARDAVAAAAAGAEPPPPAGLPDALARPGAAFVTLRKNGELRGCIGHLEARQPLWRSVQEMAQAAAERDTRFAPVGPEEVPSLEIDISVLTPMSRVSDASEIQVGRDGLYVRRGSSSGLLLPQVATEWNWDRDTFLAQTCRKAGLPPDAWRDPACEIWRFQAQIV